MGTHRILAELICGAFWPNDLRRVPVQTRDFVQNMNCCSAGFARCAGIFNRLDRFCAGSLYSWFPSGHDNRPRAPLKGRGLKKTCFTRHFLILWRRQPSQVCVRLPADGSRRHDHVFAGPFQENGPKEMHVADQRTREQTDKTVVRRAPDGRWHYSREGWQRIECVSARHREGWFPFTANPIEGKQHVHILQP